MKTLLLAAVAAVALATPALADSITLTFNSPTQTITPGSTVSFVGTLTASAANTGTVYINGDFPNIASPLTADDSGFFFGFPLSFRPGASYTGLVFTATAPSSIANGTYTGDFQVFGGSSDQDQTIIADPTFTLRVGTSTAPTPEPATWLFLSTGLVGGAVLAFRR